MTIWDTLSGRPAAKGVTATSQAPSNDQSTFVSSPQTSFGSPNASDFLGGSQVFDPSSLHPLAGLDQESLDYLKLDDGQVADPNGARSALPSRGWSDDLCYGTGVTYLAGLSIGGAWGVAEGLSRAGPTAPPKLRLNAVLNAVTRRGPFLGNSAGVIAMVYNGINSTIGYYRGKHDASNSIAAGALSGMLFKSTKGLRPALTSGAMVAAAAGVWQVTRRAVFDEN